MPASDLQLYGSSTLQLVVGSQSETIVHFSEIAVYFQSVK